MCEIKVLNYTWTVYCGFKRGAQTEHELRGCSSINEWREPLTFTQTSHSKAGNDFLWTFTEIFISTFKAKIHFLWSYRKKKHSQLRIRRKHVWRLRDRLHMGSRSRLQNYKNLTDTRKQKASHKQPNSWCQEHLWRHFWIEIITPLKILQLPIRSCLGFIIIIIVICKLYSNTGNVLSLKNKLWFLWKLSHHSKNP